MTQSSKLRVVIVGFGIQGKKRFKLLPDGCQAIVDPIFPEAHYQSIESVPLEDYDAALVCVPDQEKFRILKYLLANKKHVLVEKPIIFNQQEVSDIKNLSNSAVCYTAYNHRFEPHFVRMKDYIKSGELGKIYTCRMFYGNGTARDVRNSPWRDKDLGVIQDLGSHLLDTFLFWFDDSQRVFKKIVTNAFENKAPDHVVIHSEGTPYAQLEMTLLSWRNHFTCDIYGENGSAHIDSLCKWGPSTFTTRKRILPSGRPSEDSVILTQSDPTWELEYQHFVNLCSQGHGTNIDKDVWISRNF